VNWATDQPSPAELLARHTYRLPPQAIAQHPAHPRDSARLLVLRPGGAEISHHRFRGLGELLDPGDLLVLNDTRVIPARLFGQKIPGGGRIEVLLIRELGAGCWEAYLRGSGHKRPGLEVDLGDGYRLELLELLEGPARKVRVRGPGSVADLLSRAGHMPLPPYIRRPDTPEDRQRYQTVYGRHPGAVAAPTAGLHFTDDLLAALAARGVQRAHVTLHIGPGTFRPLRSEDLAAGELHAERFCLPDETAGAVAGARARGNRVVAVGTTTTRVLEACATEEGELRPGEGVTRLFIRSPYAPRIVDALITNFHLPRSSLLMLVCALGGRARVLAAYAEALDRGYRFYSYGDAMLLVLR
jgi:S-adenosylmethionine:tRNA ribosyltransferase-isomerase